MFYLLVSVLFTSSCFRCAVALEVTSDYAFEKYKQDFRRSYAVGSDEHDARRVIFEQRLEDVISHNARNSSWKKGMNHLSDLSAAELKARYGYRRGPSRFASPASSVRQSSSMLELDSSDSSCSGQLSSCTNSDSQCCKGLICGAAGACVKKARRLESFEWTPKLSTAYDVLEQGQCGSCWAVAAAAVIQFQAELTSGYKEVLSPQSMLSCSPNEHECGGQGGCKGATAELAFEYAKTHSKNGVLSLEQQDYTAEETPDACSSDQLSFLERKRHPGVSIKGWRKIKENDAHVMMSTLAQVGPLAASIAAGSGLHAYSSGIIPHADTDFVLNHAVVMMGYGKDESLGNMLYWNIRNSWGPDWGESGFFRLERFAPERQEPCGWDMEPEKGVVCKDANGNYPTKQWVCGVAGILADTAHVVGASVSEKSASSSGSRRLVRSHKGPLVTDIHSCKMQCQHFNMEGLRRLFNGHIDFGDDVSSCLHACKAVPSMWMWMQ